METRVLKTSDGAEVVYRFRPGRDPWVLLHGLGCDARMWERVAAELDPAVGLVVPELRGHGGSTLGWKLPSIDQWADDVHALIARERLERPAVAGLSMGGYTALALAAAFPTTARAFAFVSTSAAPDADAARERRAAGLATVRRQGWKAFAEGLMPSLFLPSRADTPRNQALFLEMCARAGDAGITCALLALANRPDRRALLPNVRVPARVVVGAQDPLTPPERARELAAALPASLLTVLAEVSHMSAMEAPAEVAAVLSGL